MPRSPVRRVRLSHALATLACAAALGAAGAAWANTEHVVSYRYEDVWPAALRFLRVDEHCTIVDKDGEAGYVLFDLDDSGRRFRGSFELVRAVDSSRRPAVRVRVHIQDRPSYMEAGMLDRFETKLRADLGSPAEPPPDPPDAPPAPSPSPSPSPSPDGPAPAPAPDK